MNVQFLFCVDLFFCAHVGFHNKNIFFLNQINFFQGIGAVFLDKEDYPKEAIYPLDAKN